MNQDTNQNYFDNTEQEKTITTDLKQPISWQALESSGGPRGYIWYFVFGLVSVGLLAVAIFLFKSITFSILIPIMALAVIVMARRNPLPIQYSISPKGIYVADRLYDFSEFRSFGVIKDPAGPYIMLLPVKRFSPGVTLYFDEKDGEKIVDMLGARLSLQDIQPDGLEKFIRFIRL